VGTVCGCGAIANMRRRAAGEILARRTCNRRSRGISSTSKKKGENVTNDRLGQSEFVVLGVVAKRRDGAHGTALLDELAELTHRPWSVGALYTILDRLEKKGFLRSEWGEATAQRGGRRKRIFRIQAAGQAALVQQRQLVDAVTSFGPGLRPVEV